MECFAFVDGLVRENDDHDPCLGRRAAEIALRIAGELIDVRIRKREKNSALWP